MAGYTAGGIGVAGIVVGTIFGVRTFILKADAEKVCVGRFCSDAGLAIYKRADDSATFADVSFGLGLTGVALGLFLVLTSGPSAAPLRASNKAWIAPLVGGRAAGIVAGGIF